MPARRTAWSRGAAQPRAPERSGDHRRLLPLGVRVGQAVQAVLPLWEALGRLRPGVPRAAQGPSPRRDRERTLVCSSSSRPFDLADIFRRIVMGPCRQNQYGRARNCESCRWRLGRNVGQPDHILANPLMSHKAERRQGPGEIWLAVTEHDWVKVDSILIDQAKVGQASRQVRASNFDLPSRSVFSSRIAPSRSASTSLALGPTDFNERETTHFGWFRHAAAKAYSAASHSG